MPFELDIETALRLVQGFDRAATVSGFSRLEGGNTEVYRIEVGDSEYGSLVLKIYPDDPEWAPSKEALIADWLRDLTPPIPTWLRLDESRSLMPRRYALLTALPGRSLRDWMTEPDITQAYRQMGQLLRRIHSVPMPAFGYVFGKGIENPISKNADYMTKGFDDVFRRFCNLGADPALAQSLQRCAESSFDVLEASDGAVLAHDDLHQGNVLAVRGKDGRLQLSGLVDFGNARAADKLFDLSKALFCSGHEDPRSYRPILEGYGPINHPEPDRALWLYTLFHRLTMWCWLTEIGVNAGADKGPGGLIRDLWDMVSNRSRDVSARSR